MAGVTLMGICWDILMEEITVERATNDEIKVLLNLIQKQFLEHQIDCPADSLETAIHEMFLREGLGFFMVAKNNDQTIGFAAISYAWTLEHGGKSAWLDELYVVAEKRGLGVGSILLESVIEEAKREGCLAIDLEVEADHRRAEHLYARYGFAYLPRRRWVKHLSD